MSFDLKMSGSARRAAKRAGEVDAFTRAQAIEMVLSSSSPEDCLKWLKHRNSHVKRIASKRIELLNAQPLQMSEFDVLVARFRSEGKKNPEASARSSLAAKAQAAQKRARLAAEN